MVFNVVYDEINEEYLFDEPSRDEKIDGSVYHIEYDGGIVFDEDIVFDESNIK